MHLRAASALISDLKSNEMTQARKQLSASSEAALFFFAGVIGWYDILSCATTGAMPFSYCENCLEVGGCIKLDKIMGSENWAMVCIMDIASLDEWKTKLQASGMLSIRDLADRAGDIERRLEAGLNGIPAVGGSSSSTPLDHGSTEREMHDLVCMITRAFACSALVYLHVVVSGPRPTLPEIRESVARTISTLRAFPDQKVAATLSWPLCIAGCVALGEEERNFFRDLNAIDRMEIQPFGNSSKVLKIIEECWIKQEQGQSAVDWRVAMKSLGIDILLI